MSKTDASKKGFEGLIVSALTGKVASDTTGATGAVQDDAGVYGGGYGGDRAKRDFPRATQPEAVERLGLAQDGPAGAFSSRDREETE